MDHFGSMMFWKGDSGFGTYLERAMARLARMPQRTVLLGGIVFLALIVTLDGAARPLEVRLVPLYIAVLCITSWALRRRLAMIFAIITAIVAMLPDIGASASPFGMATIVNALIRAAIYIFLALIITTYRRAYDEADYRAMYDGLTGALNKLPFQAAVARQLIRAQRTHDTLIAACIDLDGFKLINAKYGPAAGDSALRAFAQEAMRAIRGSDLVGRLGGDDFAFLLGTSSADHAEAFVHLLHQRVTTTLGKTGLPLSCTIGALIAGPEATLTGMELFEQADGLMRRGKSQGHGVVLIEFAPGTQFKPSEVRARA